MGRSGARKADCKERVHMDQEVPGQMNWPVAKPKHLSSIPRAHTVEEKGNFCRFPSGLTHIHRKK